ncbi:pentapeptide repeat-containing protein [Amycolatopsis alba]|uniref:Pentapeptide repeat-containing protein n=1 Tax=Amycolatopsis alba DSM 44262 TaxID=1125972 RepID=A0A229RQF2_AMYAL|nr:pentapeptide repeat-containing protein [Amycolatopsis alba]OXM48877.1 hypothetical protein CFP75_20680 [Amycolatopsis alba DSM 44262]
MAALLALATLIDLDLHDCEINEARFSKATFEGDARFHGAAFIGDANFAQATFNGGTMFVRATIQGVVVVSEARIRVDSMKNSSWPPGLTAKATGSASPTTSGRTAAIQQHVLTMPSSVVADALGYHAGTTTKIATRAGTTWSRYAPGDHSPP